MGIVSVNDLDKLFWAGRYCERALTLYEKFTELPSELETRRDFVRRMGVMCDIVADTGGFSGENDGISGNVSNVPSSAVSDIVLPETAILSENGAVAAAARALSDNVSMLRHILSGKAARIAETVADSAESGDFDTLVLCGYAFFGIADSRLTEAAARAAVAAGRACEKLDILSRLGEDVFLLETELRKLKAVTGDSGAVENMISKFGLSLIDEDLKAGRVGDVSAHTVFLESDNEYT